MVVANTRGRRRVDMKETKNGGIEIRTKTRTKKESKEQGRGEESRTEQERAEETMYEQDRRERREKKTPEKMSKGKSRYYKEDMKREKGKRR